MRTLRSGSVLCFLYSIQTSLMSRLAASLTGVAGVAVVVLTISAPIPWVGVLSVFHALLNHFLSHKSDNQRDGKRNGHRLQGPFDRGREWIAGRDTTRDET